MAGPLELAAWSALGGFVGAAAPGLGLILWKRWKYREAWRQKMPSWRAPFRRLVCLFKGHEDDPVRVGSIVVAIYCKRRCGWQKL